MEIQVGEYIRTEDGIKKIVKINEGKLSTYYGKYICEPKYKNSSSISIKNIIKHSFDLKELVKKGDFVNGYEVDDFDGYDEEGNYFEKDLGIPIYDDANMDCIIEYRPIRLMKIRSIVTKEQFETMEYEVK